VTINSGSGGNGGFGGHGGGGGGGSGGISCGVFIDTTLTSAVLDNPSSNIISGGAAGYGGTGGVSLGHYGSEGENGLLEDTLYW